MSADVIIFEEEKPHSIQPAQDSRRDNRSHVHPQGVELLAHTTSIFIFSYRSLHPSISPPQPPAESGQKSATSRGWMLVRTLTSNTTSTLGGSDFTLS